MVKRILVLALVAAGVVAAPAFSLRPYQPEPVDFESGAGVQQKIGDAVQSKPIRAGKRFNLVGLRWRGRAEPGVAVRTRREGGGWSRWTTLYAHTEDAPDPGRGEPMPQGTSAPTWVGEADWVQYRLTERVPGVRLHYVNVKGSSTPGERMRTALRRTAGSVAAALTGTPAAEAAGAQPGIVGREAWGASACRPRSAPQEGTVRAAFVHHTVSANQYTRAEARSVVLGICRYHRNSNGWDDIGYNFLVDKYGTIYEGRAGGIDAAVVGAQAQGYNAQSTGIANLGTHTSVRQSSGALDAMARLIRWKLPLHGVPTSGTATLTSSGGSTNRYAVGRSVVLQRVAGHRDTNATSCPGDALYAQMPGLRARVGSVGPAGLATRLDAELSRRSVGYRAPVAVSGTLARLDGVPVSGPRVAIQVRSGRGFKTVAKARTDSVGRYSAVVRPRGTRVIRVRFGGGSGLLGSASLPTRLSVRPVIGVRGIPSSVAAKRLVRLRGTVRPHKRRVAMVLQRLRGLSFRTVSTKAIPPRRGRFASALRISRRGTYRVYFVVRGDRSTARASTRRRTLIVY